MRVPRRYMQVWNKGGETLTGEYQEALWQTNWLIHNQRSRLNAALLAIGASGSRGFLGVEEEMGKLQEFVTQYKDLICLRENQPKANS